MPTPSEILGVAEQAAPDEIRRAYRRQAFRWHPDRFAEGPERAWAESRMIEINEAYRSLLHSPAASSGNLDAAEQLLSNGDLRGAARVLMGEKERTARWNYLYARVLTKRGEYERAEVYYALAVRGDPENSAYKAALSACSAKKNASGGVLARFSRVFGRKPR